MKKTKLIKNFFRHYRTSSKANLILSNELQEILFGLMLSMRKEEILTVIQEYNLNNLLRI